MKSSIITLLFISITINSICQIRSVSNGFAWSVKDYNKEIALYKAKSYLYKEILGISEKVSRFELIPLSAASSGELTTLFYKSEEKQKEGLILGFFGDYKNESGYFFQGYGFKNLDKDEAIEFLGKISKAIEDNSKFLDNSVNNNNIYFSYKDIDVVIYASGMSYDIRLFWNNFDSNWEKSAFEKSKRRFEKKIK
jgi:hypothetical protein